MSRAGQQTNSLLVHGNQQCTVGHIAQKPDVEERESREVVHYLPARGVG